MTSETEAVLDEMERSAGDTLKALGAIEQTVRAGEEALSRDDALAVLKVAQTALDDALKLLGAFKTTAAQAKQATALAAASVGVNAVLTEELGKANLATESALGLLPEPKKRN